MNNEVIKFFKYRKTKMEAMNIFKKEQEKRINPPFNSSNTYKELVARSTFKSQLS